MTSEEIQAINSLNNSIQQLTKQLEKIEVALTEFNTEGLEEKIENLDKTLSLVNDITKV